MALLLSEGGERVESHEGGHPSVFVATFGLVLADNVIPLLTTKRVYWKTAAREMIWFLTGETNIRPLVEQGVHIWTDWPLDEYRPSTGEQIDRDAFERRVMAAQDFLWKWDDIGPVYGAQWVNWPSYDFIEAHLYHRKEKRT